MACTPCYTADINDFRTLFPELDPVEDSLVQYYLDRYDCTLSDTYWGCTKPEAQLYLSAHMIALSQKRQANTQITAGGQVVNSSGSGALTSASDVSLSVGYAPNATMLQGSDADTFYGTTPYGQYYLSLKRTFMPIGLVAGCQ